MRFTVDVSIGMTKRARLLQNGSWREYQVPTLFDSDAMFHDIPTAYRALDSIGALVELPSGISPVIKREDSLSFQDIAHHAHPCVLVHRDFIPQAPSLEQVIREILQSRDGPHCLVADVEGIPHVLPFHQVSLERPTFAARTESFLGVRFASPNESEIKLLYRLLLDAWVQHLKTLRLGTYSDVSTKTLAQLQKEAKGKP